MSKESPRLALIGAGYWGKNLVRNFHGLGCLDLICDRSEELLARFREQYPDVETCHAVREALSRDDIDAVAIATPAQFHFEQARDALLAGKHVFVEKPMALREGDVTVLIDLARKRGLTLMVGHLLQYHPVFRALKQLAADGELGRINYIYSNRLNLGKIRREENILWSFAPHDISMILSLAGEEPDSVMATGGNFLHHEIADVTTTHLTFPSGMQAHVFVSWLHPYKEQKLVVVGDKNMALFDDTRPWEEKLLLYPHGIKWTNNIPVPAEAEARKVVVPQDEPLKLECAHFLECVVKGTRPLTDGEEARRVLGVLNNAQKSLDRHGQRVFPAPRNVAGENGPTIHPTAYVDDDTAIGAGTRIWHFSHILSGTTVGANCNIGQNVVIGPNVSVGEGCKIQNNVSVYEGVTLEDGVFCGPSMVFTNVFNPRSHISRRKELKPTLVRRGATLGANCTIVCGNVVGRYAFVGAGAVVTRNVPDYALVVGNSAVQKGWVCRCGARLPEDLTCIECGTRFDQGDTGLKVRGDEA
ncbi:oxidoreductase [Pseudodesulfovibrio sp. F-1]|uniref:Oxidoreductase n=1 Tax=Pseudodesulfovibrio alkaliphilus TaxID=2661613 RepID=A0A7K1KND1_9BACT|nr:Gfo/Idh/MocA family oxidoreductase [Pseudodesulfovibrio alkaliphilus]MUM77537.1 oxidoreductase [Pseudodesulfovibrio alkaliphilus]